MSEKLAHNKYCALKDLTNESAVEQFFTIRLLKDLGFHDSEILTKTSIKELVIGKGSKKETFKPDYAIRLKHQIRLLVDAKGPEENIDDYLYQISGYALSVNQEYDDDEKPIKFCVLTNSKITKIYHWARSKPLLELDFADFVDGNAKFEQLRPLLDKKNLTARPKQTKLIEEPFDFVELPVAKLDSVFRACHDLIWKKDKKKPTTAFYEFCKLFYVKLEEDKRIHELGRPPTRQDFRFSEHWIESMEDTLENPVDAILFTKLRKELNRKVQKKEKKRIFGSKERIALKPSTIKEVVKLLEHIDLHGIEHKEDLNGRMFETFLSSTIRGKDLGQFFTPRSVVEFMVVLADLQVGKKRTDCVLDLCCGSGGFLIDAMADMWKKLDSNKSLSSVERENLKNEVVTKYLWGVDADTDEKLRISRIARLNMVFHGDGSNRIYWLPDSLDKKLIIEKGTPDELKDEAEEFKKALEDGLRFDVVLTNPPFSMRYESSKKDEKAILEDYALAKQPDTEKLRASVKSNVLFLERNFDLLKPHGKLLTIVDESVLNAHSDSEVRSFIKDKFIIRAVVSLPRNTFVNAETVVKTSILYLMKKENASEEQPNIFMAISQCIGHNDAGKRTPELNDLPIILGEFRRFEQGERL